VEGSSPRGALIVGLVAALAVSAPAASAATLTVNSSADGADDNAGNGVCHTAQDTCTLRAAIQEANATTAADVAAFSIGVGQVTIQPGSPLPEITKPLTLDGATQPLGMAMPGRPRVELDGAAAGAGADGLVISAGSSQVKSLAIGRFNRYGIFMYAPGVPAGNNTVEDSNIGTDASGLIARPNRSGVVIYASHDNVISGNVISGNGFVGGQLNEGTGIQVYGLGATANVVKGNYVGVGADGTTKLANTLGGISISDSMVGTNDVAADTRVGGSEPADRNVIAGNGSDAFGCDPALSGAILCNGIQVYVAGNTRIAGNHIGVDVLGQALGNAGEGVILARGASDALVGVDAADVDERNVISANARNGVVIAGGNTNRVSGNRIGTNSGGSAAAIDTTGAASNKIGVLVTETNTGEGSSDTTVGGPGEQGNLISGNRIGVRVFGKATGTLIRGNRIGTNAAGTATVANTEDGVDLFGTAGNEVGGAALDAYRNLISGNARHGVRIRDAGAHDNLVQGNRLGTAANGTAPLPNKSAGISIENGAHDNEIGSRDGTSDPEADCTSPCNIVARNGGPGVSLTGAATFGNRVLSNQLSDNDGLGIDLVVDPTDTEEKKVTANDTGDTDAGPNSLANFPVGVMAYKNPQTHKTELTGVVDTINPTGGRVDLYGMDTVDPSGFGEGLRHVARVTPTDSGSFSVATTAAYSFYSATYTTASGSTSEFSPVCGDPDGDGNPDSDSDGLCDDWETQGIDFNGDGTADLPLDQPPYFADPFRKDIFVEVDYMGGIGHSDAPQAGALEDVRKVFDDAPVDGPAGVSLNLSPGNADKLDEQVPHVDPLPIASRGAGAEDDFVDIRDGSASDPCDGHFGTVAQRAADNCADILGAKRLAFRYALFGHRFSESPTSSGVADAMPGDDLMVTLSSWSDADVIRMGGGRGVCGGASGCRRALEASTFMHELGHTLGLHHGGGDDDQFKPNYLSVMNYTFQFANNTPGRPLDYSRWLLPTLNEANLDERKGIDGGPPPPPDLAARWPQTAYTYLAADSKCRFSVTPTTGSIDWNLSGGAPDASVTAGINDFYSALVADGNLASDCSDPSFQSGALASFNDWPNVIYSPRSSPGYLDKGVFPLGAASELTEEDALAAAESTDADGDGVMNADDNCSTVANAGQADGDGDGIGDACEAGAPGPGPGSGSTSGGSSGGPLPPGAAADTLGPRVTLGRMTSRRGVLTVRVGCPAGEADGCAGRLTIRTSRAVAARKKRRVTLGRARFRVSAGRTAGVRVRLSKKSLRLVRRIHRLRVTVSAAARDRAGNTGSRSRTYRLR
jgi:CSLREA domain-containing protein